MKLRGVSRFSIVSLGVDRGVLDSCVPESELSASAVGTVAAVYWESSPLDSLEAIPGVEAVGVLPGHPQLLPQLDNLVFVIPDQGRLQSVATMVGGLLCGPIHLLQELRGVVLHGDWGLPAYPDIHVVAYTLGN